MTNDLIDEKPLPAVTHNTTITVAGVELTLCHLDDGRTIVPQKDVVRFLEELASGRAVLTQEDMKKVNKLMGPKA